MSRVSAARKDWPTIVLSLIWVTSPSAMGATAANTNDAAVSYIMPSITLESTERSEVLMDTEGSNGASAHGEPTPTFIFSRTPDVSMGCHLSLSKAGQGIPSLVPRGWKRGWLSNCRLHFASLVELQSILAGCRPMTLPPRMSP